jgi:hypothetical protein
MSNVMICFGIRSSGGSFQNDDEIPSLKNGGACLDSADNNEDFGQLN